MSGFIARQPNGLLTRFSCTTDRPEQYNMTDEEYIELRAEFAREDARYTLAHHLRPFSEVQEYFCPNNMTEEEFQEYLVTASSTPEVVVVKPEIAGKDE